MRFECITQTKISSSRRFQYRIFDLYFGMIIPVGVLVATGKRNGRIAYWHPCDIDIGISFFFLLACAPAQTIPQYPNTTENHFATPDFTTLYILKDVLSKQVPSYFFCHDFRCPRCHRQEEWPNCALASVRSRIGGLWRAREEVRDKSEYFERVVFRQASGISWPKQSHSASEENSLYRM